MTYLITVYDKNNILITVHEKYKEPIAVHENFLALMIIYNGGKKIVECSIEIDGKILNVLHNANF